MNKKSIAGFVGLVAALAFATTAMAATFSTNLTVGSTGADVTALQVVLNSDSATQVAASGVGSAGNESSYFGTLTEAAVIKFQIKNGITPAVGFVGPITRAKLNTMGGAAATTGGAAATTGGAAATASTEALCPNGMTLASNCAAAVVVASAALCPNGMTVASNCASAPAEAASSGEGSVTLSYDTAIADALAVNRGEAKNVIGIKVKATGSDMKVTRLWLDVNSRIWLSANKIELMDGSTVLGTINLAAGTVTEVTAGSQYKVEFNGLNLVVAKGATKILVVKITRPTLTITSGTITVTAANSSLRAVDAAGITETYSLSALGNRALNLPAATAGVGTLTNTLSVGTPAAQSVSGLSTTVGTLTAVKLMDFDLKAKDGNVNITALTTTLATTANSLVEQISSVELRDGATVLKSYAAATSTAFTGLDINVSSGATKTLSVWVYMNHIASGFAVKGSGVSVAVSGVTGTSGDSYDSANAAATATGNAQYMFKDAPTFALGTATASQVAGTSTGLFTGSYSLSFVVTAPAGSDIYLNATSTIVRIGTVGGTIATSTTASGIASKGIVLPTWDKIAAGTSRTITVVSQIPGNNAAGFVGVRIGNETSTGLIWTDTDHATSPAVVTQFWGLADIKTSTVYIN